MMTPMPRSRSLHCHPHRRMRRAYARHRFDRRRTGVHRSATGPSREQRRESGVERHARKHAARQRVQPPHDGSRRSHRTGAATGSVLLGDGTLLQPPTDPDVGVSAGRPVPGGGPLGVFAGVRDTILDGRLSAARLTFHIDQMELWAQWCALQKPYLFAARSEGVLVLARRTIYLCIPTSGRRGYVRRSADVEDHADRLRQGGALRTGKPVRVLGDGLPRVVIATEPDITFDLTITSATADGTIVGELGDHGVHFVRAQ